MSSTLRTLSAAMAAGLALCACAGAPTRFYTLDAAPTAGPARMDYAGPPVRIDAVHIPAALDRPELVRETAGQRFTVSDNDRWAAPVGELLRRVLTQNLAARLPGGAVIYPDAPKPAGAGGVVVDILALSPSGGAVVMDASWTVLPPHSANASGTAPTRQRTIRLSTPAQTAGVSGNAAELSALADQLAAAMAADLGAARG